MPSDIAKVISSFTGLDKASIILISFDEDSAGEVLALMNEREIQRLTSHASRLRHLTMEQINVVRQDFLLRLTQSSDLIIGEARQKLKNVLKNILPPERYSKFVEFMESNDELSEGFEALKWVDAQTIAMYLRDEHPQTMALVLAHLETEKASEILLRIPREVQADVVMRIATLDRINPELVKDIQEVIITEVMSSGVNKSRQVGGTQAVAEILNNLDSQSEENIFTVMEEENPDMSERIREMMFIFEDLSKIDDRGIQLIMKEVTNDILTLSLKTASEELREKIFANISSRAAEMIRDDLETMGPTKLADVEQAQQEIVKVCRRLEADGKLAITQKGGGDVFV